MKEVTLVFLRREGEILLAMKKRGFGQGKWNGTGGKVEPGETVLAAAVREAREEIGVEIAPEDLVPVAEIEFTFEGKPEWGIHGHVFLTNAWQGEPSESEEMAPRWFGLDEIPYDGMWADDEEWLPLVLDGKRLDASFHFTGDGSAILRQSVRVRK